jgi:hypothetical protein
MSIKKKFVTAITTAGLLAGLFGSAFVPSAAGRSSNDLPRAAATELFISGGRDSACDYETLYGDGGAASDGCIEPNVKTKAKPNAFRLASWSTGSGSESDDFSNANDLSFGFSLSNSAGDPVEVADLTATSTGYVEVAWAYDDNDAVSQVLGCADDYLDDEAFGLTDTVEGIDSSEFTYYSEGDFYLCVQSKSKNSLGTSTITITANGVKVATLTIQVIGDLNSLTATAAYPRIAMENGDLHKFMTVVGKDAAGQVINNGADGWAPGFAESTGVGTVDFGFALGDYVDDSFDELGTDDSQFEEHADGSDQDNYIIDGVNATGVSLASDVCIKDSLDSDAGKVFNLGVEIDNWDGDLVQSNTVAVTCTGPSNEAILSGITASDVSGAADWGTSTEGKADADGVIAVTAVVKDQAGRLMGKDDTTGFDPGTYSVEGDSTALTDDLQIDDSELLEAWFFGVGFTPYYTNGVGVDGKTILATLRPDMAYLGTFRYTVTIDDVNQGNSGLVDDELETELLYTAGSGIESDYSLTRTRNAAKTSAVWTADFGVACSNQFVYFDWENGDGTKGNLVNGGVSLKRRADTNGKAKFTLTKRNMTVYVTAYSCDNVNGGLEELGPLKSRFR